MWLVGLEFFVGSHQCPAGAFERKANGFIGRRVVANFDTLSA
jgi:hypothetical protein